MLKGPPEELASTASLETEASSKSLFSTTQTEWTDNSSKKAGSWFSLSTKVNLEDTPLSEDVVDDTIDRGCWDESSFPVRGTCADSDSDATYVSMTHHAAKNFTIVGADDFLPLFVYVLVSFQGPPFTFIDYHSGSSKSSSINSCEGNHVNFAGFRGAIWRVWVLHGDFRSCSSTHSRTR